MSPEQADPVREDIDIRTDVYSLGAVLYELLTGALPLDFNKLAYGEVLRRLRDQDVPRPSTKITTLGSDSTIAAKNRASDPPTLVRQLRGDPDAIALKALEKDRARRYASASELAADTGRYLRHEPVTAHPPGVAYRTRKYLRRHRLGLAVAAIATLAVLLLITWWSIPKAVSVVESIVQLTDDGQPKDALVSDGSSIYFSEGGFGNHRIAQVPVGGGAVTPIETRFTNTVLQEVAHDGSGLLVVIPHNIIAGLQEGPLWWIPLPNGEPRRLGSFDTIGGDIVSDGRIVFGESTLHADPKGADTRTEWLLADKDGSNPRKLASFPAPPVRFGVRRTVGGFLLVRKCPAIAGYSKWAWTARGFTRSGSSATMSTISCGLRMRSTWSIKLRSLESQTSGCFLCELDFSAARANQFGSQMDQCLTPFLTQAGTESRFLSSG